MLATKYRARIEVANHVERSARSAKPRVQKPERIGEESTVSSLVGRTASLAAMSCRSKIGSDTWSRSRGALQRGGLVRRWVGSSAVVHVCAGTARATARATRHAVSDARIH